MSPRLIDLTTPVERAFLVAVDTGSDDGWTAEESLQELAALAVTAGAEVVGAEWQNRRHVDPNWYLGKGRAEELVSARGETGFGLLVADDELSPNQQRALEELLKVKVLDRSGLILDIFAQHAQTHEGATPGRAGPARIPAATPHPPVDPPFAHGGGIGTRGPGETQLETDRRVIREKIKKLRQRLETVRRTRDTTARSRERRARAERRHRGLHQRRQVDDAQRPGRQRRGPRGGQAVRHAGPDQPLGAPAATARAPS